MEHKFNFDGPTIEIEQFNARYIQAYIVNAYGEAACILMTKKEAKAVAAAISSEADRCSDLPEDITPVGQTER